MFIVTSALHVYLEQRRGHVGTREALSRAVGSAVVFVLCAVAVFPVGGLLGYHLRVRCGFFIFILVYGYRG